MFSILTVALCAPVASAEQTQAADDLQVAVPTASTCVDLTLVKTEAPEGRVDIYVAGSPPTSPPPEDPSLADLVDYLDTVRAHVLSFVEQDPTQAALQVELIVPKQSEDDGYRFTFSANATRCVSV